LDKAMYWLNWILEWERLNIKKGDGFHCAVRVRKYIKPQFHNDIIWMVWDVIFQEATIRNNDKMMKQLIGLFKLFKYNFTSPGKRKKAPLIVHAINLLVYEDRIRWEASITAHVKLLAQANANTNMLYLEYKQKGKNNYQQKEDGLQILTRDNYLVSDQKVQTSQSKNNVSSAISKKNAKLVANNDLHKMNILEMMDKKMMMNRPQQQLPPRQPNLFQTMNRPYQKTEDVIKQIQSIIN